VTQPDQLPEFLIPNHPLPFILCHEFVFKQSRVVKFLSFKWVVLVEQRTLIEQFFFIFIEQ
jgi:hypothetical protein